MHRITRSLAAATLAAVVASATVLTADSFNGSGALAGSNPSDPVSAPTRFATSDDADPRAYWTPERMRSAKPMTVSRQREDAKVRVSNETGNRAQRTMSTDTQAEPRLTRASEFQPAAEYPFPYGRRSVENPLRKVSPYRQVGRVFFRQNGVRYSCSGSSVVGGWRSVVFTAGHCLNDGAGNWSTDVVFVPARRNGKRKNPYSKFSAKELWVPAGWSDNHV
jgi:V8-like Glu-specific endopeptidase